MGLRVEEGLKAGGEVRVVAKRMEGGNRTGLEKDGVEEG